MTALKLKKIGEIMVDSGVISSDDRDRALAVANGSNGKLRIGQACIQAGLINELDLAEALAEQYGLSVIDLEKHEVDERVLDLIPVELLFKARILPLKGQGADAVLLAVSDPTDIPSLDDVEMVLSSSAVTIERTVVVTVSDVEKQLKRGTGSKKILREASAGLDMEELHIGTDKDAESVLSLEKITGDSSPVVKLVDTTIYDALSKSASDIHMESTSSGLIVKYRLDGVLHKVMGPLDKTFQASIISRVKVMSELDISERRIPQDGRFKVRLKNKTIDFRVSIMPSLHGEDAVIRVLDKEHLTKEFEQLRLDLLGIGEREIKHLRRMIREPYGMILVTGPTGSGKTTTLYAAVTEINSGEEKIITIEDPIEYELRGVTQIPVNEKKGLTFAKGLRSILRHDPDKIMVGEIRDHETAEIAIQAALTGHLVFTTVHANNVFDVIGRFIHMGIEPYNFVSSLNCVIAQRLLRTICKFCKTEYKPTREEFLASGLDPKKYAGKTFYKSNGCDECFSTGFHGRKAIVELLELTDEIRDMIAAKEPPSSIKSRAVKDGMITLRQAAVEAVLRGETTLDEINRVTFIE